MVNLLEKRSPALGRAFADVVQSRPSERRRTMRASTISREAGSALAAFIEARRRELVAAIVRSPVLLRPGSLAASVFAATFLDHIAAEADSEDRDVLDHWVETGTTPEDGLEHARIVTIACAVVSSAYVADLGHCDDVISYLALRAGELEKRFRTERRSKSGKFVDPANLVHKDDVVSALLAAIEARDSATFEHSRAVGLWCGRIAKSLGMNAEMQSFSALCGALHDVGKIATPTEVLLKNGPLDESEWDVMREHAATGARMLERIPSLRVLAPVVRAHHERLDGRGYPDRLAGEGIPMVARIVAVADSFHAMISRRPYRDPMTVPQALMELRLGLGTQWDPLVGEAMLAVVQPGTSVRTLLRAGLSGVAG